LENLHTEVDINKAWEAVRGNMKISAKERLGYYELKHMRSAQKVSNFIFSRGLRAGY
jgi:hypothetical protein